MVVSNNAVYVDRTTDGSWRVVGTRVSLDSIIHAYWQGRLPEAIVADFPTLSLEQVHGAIAFYLHNRAAIDKYLSEQDERWLELQNESEQKNGPLLKRIRAAAANSVAGETL